MISSLKIKLNRSWKFRRNWNVPLMSLERSWWAGFNGIYLVRFGFRMWEILIFKWFLLLKIQINFKKPGFGRKNHLRMLYHLGQWHRPRPSIYDVTSGDSLVVFLLVDQNPLKANEKCWNLHPAYGSQIIAAGCVGVFQTSHPWRKYSVVESPNLCANGTQMVQVLVMNSKGVPEMYIDDCNLNSHNQPGLSPSQHHQTCLYSLSSHFHALFLYAHYVIVQSSIGMTNIWSSNTWN